MKRILGEAWKLKKDFDIQVTRDNSLRLQLYCYDDKNKVLLGGPWHLERQLLIFKDVPPDLDMKKLDFTNTDFWVRVRGLPLKLRNQQMAEKIGEMFGGFVRWDELHSGVSSEFLRLRVTMNVTKPLRRVIKLQGKEGTVSYKIGYERMPIYCFRCGILGHLKKSCAKNQEGQNDEADPYGPWLRAESPLRRIPMKEKEKTKNLVKLWEEVKAEREKKTTEVVPLRKVDTLEKPQSNDIVDDLQFLSVKGRGNGEQNKAVENKIEDSDRHTNQQSTLLLVERKEFENNEVSKEKSANENVILSVRTEGKKWKRVDRTNPSTRQQTVNTVTAGKRDSYDDMEIDVDVTQEKKQKALKTPPMDGDVAVPAEEQGRRAQ
ncbi:unnamed protein product [Linum trigynum]|uniref:CCHC-type domain-containing protein n=1 Tax=Linum trigynum TaxID=586398 RepID=A0AAV2FCB9_9ROSI